MTSEVAMSSSEIGIGLEERMQRLEQENRRLKLMGGAVMLLLGVGVVLGFAPAPNPQEIKAEKFVMVDQDGNSRAVLGMEGKNAALVMSDPTGKRLLFLVSKPDGRSSLDFFDVNGTPRLELALARTGPVLNCIGEDSELRASLDGAGPSSTLMLSDAGSNAKPVLEVGMGKLKIYDENGEAKDLANP
jgi:hypothetical protein